jgi:hypothetical protein
MDSWADGGVPTVLPGFVDPSAICEQPQHNDIYDSPLAWAPFVCANRQNQDNIPGTRGPVLLYNHEENL